MKLTEKYLYEIIKDHLINLYNEEISNSLFIQETNNSNFGDFQTNFAMINAKTLKKAPRKIAEEILENFPQSDLITKVEIAGPGFINIFISDDFVGEQLKKLGNEEIEFDLNTKGNVIIDYSSPNIAKPMHIGHLRSTVIGDAIKRIYRYLGYTVIGDNHLGDWGTQFGSLIVGYDRWLDKENYKQNPIDELERIYVKFTQESEKNVDLIEIAREEQRKLQSGDERNTKLWKEFIEVSLKDYEKIYKRMDIDFDTYYGESFYHNIMKDVVKDLIEKNIAFEDDGALVVSFDDDNLPNCIVRKSNGSFLYTTSDLACIKFRRENYDINRLIYVTDQRQQTHFKQVFTIADNLGWNEKKDHVYFGLMRFVDGVFSTRKGNVIKLKELLDKATQEAEKILLERNSNKENLKEKAEIIGVGAVKYADLSQNRTSDIIFDWEKMLSFNSNSSPYLQYTYARINSLIKKSDLNDIQEIYIFENDYEKNLAKNLLKFPNAVMRAGENYKPNLLTDYLYELAQTFNSFYNNVRVLNAEGKYLESKLALCKKTAYVLEKGLNLLGIKTLEEM
ncbi:MULTISPECIES: arginine--tRNA ligase [Oceanotoga]|jgi:arginyl-tRNA synthetase|uniref:Arginine--tRNA ligase n=1 Tax=Oceanotoga teriensis TaxID=515440 RepID=A0AA45C825_9BACT|nr:MULTISPECIES: arginine--tRNA ligase [Oceanotoga]MDN5341321.1 arginyl-tRNA synthetase [Oceanotoga sp.]MDO7976953.1 arginine--tRNA ligase [Oceanotoga teriensis]PWJ95745.1 arginyl-tRNA synthetase [Oceanotoga teriensis]